MEINSIEEFKKLYKLENIDSYDYDLTENFKKELESHINFPTELDYEVNSYRVIATCNNRHSITNLSLTNDFNICIDKRYDFSSDIYDDWNIINIIYDLANNNIIDVNINTESYSKNKIYSKVLIHYFYNIFN